MLWRAMKVAVRKREKLSSEVKITFGVAYSA